MREACWDEEIRHWNEQLISLSDAMRPYLPEYFGPLPPPMSAPPGAITRYKAVCNGAYLVDSGGRWFIAASRAIACFNFDPFPDILEPMPKENGYYFIEDKNLSPVAEIVYDLFPELEQYINLDKNKG